MGIFNSTFWKSFAASVLTSSIVATGISAWIAKDAERETRAYELKYEVYSEINSHLADLQTAILERDRESTSAALKHIRESIPNILLVTNDKALVRQISSLSLLFVDDIHGPENRKKVLQSIVNITVSLSDDFSNYVTTTEEKDVLTNALNDAVEYRSNRQ